MSNFSWDEISCCCPTSFASSKYLNVIYLMNVDINIIDTLILHWGVILPIFFIGWFWTQMFWFEAGCRFASHESTCHRLRAWCWLCFHARYPRERQPWITGTYRYWPKKSLHFTFNPFLLKTLPRFQCETIWIPKVQDLCVLIFFLGVFRWTRGQFPSQLRQVLLVFMATSLTTCALWNLLWIGPGLPTAPSGLNGRGLMSLRLRGLANGIISHFDLTFVLVEMLHDVRKLHVNLSVGASRGASQSLETFGVWTSRGHWLWG